MARKQQTKGSGKYIVIKGSGRNPDPDRALLVGGRERGLTILRKPTDLEVLRAKRDKLLNKQIELAECAKEICAYIDDLEHKARLNSIPPAS